MRIALFHTTLPEPGRKLGGVEVAVHRLANALVEHGQDVTVYTLSNCPDGALYKHRILFRGWAWLKNDPFGRLCVVPLLLNFVSFGDSEVVHLHGDDWFYLFRRWPSVRTIHGSALREAQNARTVRRRWSQYAVYPLEHISSALCSRCIASGEDTARIYGLQTVIGYGIDTRVFFPGRKSSFPLVLFVGTWGGRKRGEILYRWFTEHVLMRIPDARLCMVSDYCPEHPAVFAERFPRDETLARWYREAWVFAYPSLYEGFGLAYLEALASGTVILTSSNEGAREVLEDGKFGVFGHDAAFADELTSLLLSSERRKTFEAAGIARAQSFSWDRLAAQHLEIYRAALQKRKGP